MKIAYLGPAGTFTEDALREAAPEGGFKPLRRPTVHDALVAVEAGDAERALVPFENSIEGSVRSTLDALAFETPKVTIVGEHDYVVRAHLIAARVLDLAAVTAVLSHPQPEQHRRGGARRERGRPPLGGDRRSRSRRSLRLHGDRGGDRGRGHQRDPIRLDRAGRDRGGRRR